MADEIEIETEQVDRPRGLLLGRTLNKLRGERFNAMQAAKNKMFDRHGITYRDRNKYKIVEDRITHRDGKEVIEIRLYELKDAAVVTIKTDVTTELQGGINNLVEFNDGR